MSIIEKSNENNIPLISEFVRTKKEVVDNHIKSLDIEEKLEFRKYLALNDCVFFGETYIKPYDKKWTSKTADFHYELYWFLFKGSELGLVLAVLSFIVSYLCFYLWSKK